MNGFSETLLDHSRNPRNTTALPNPDAVGMASRDGRFPHVVLFLYLDQINVRDARFQATGCAIAAACGSILTETLRGQTIDECRRIESTDIEHALGGLPAAKHFCAELAIEALRNALATLSELTA
jgi:nitrogen fixation NifU-like protein